MSANNKPNDASKFSSVPRGRGEQQAAYFCRAMSRSRHAALSERELLTALVASMFWERRVR